MIDKKLIENKHDPISDERWVLASLEHDQLVKAKKHTISRRILTAPQLVVVWALRLYLLFMMSVVGYQLWTATR